MTGSHVDVLSSETKESALRFPLKENFKSSRRFIPGSSLPVRHTVPVMGKGSGRWLESSSMLTALVVGERGGKV